MGRSATVVLGGVLGLLAVAVPSSAKTPWTIAPAPAWVERVEVDPTLETPARGGHETLLVDRQVRVSDKVGEEFYVHVVDRATAQVGLTSLGQLELTVDPTYQRLVLHRVRVYRDGAWLNRLDASHIREVVREPRLDYQVYDGRKSVVVTLPDLRVGDLVETAYSFVGSHPSADGRVDGRLALAYGRDVAQLRLRLLLPEGRAFTVRTPDRLSATTTHTKDGFTEHVWRREQVPRVDRAEDSPRWYDGRPRVEYSDWADWAAVAAWGLKRYADSPLPPEVVAEVEAIKARMAKGTTRAEAAVEALRWVQREIRYVGVEIGVGAFDPSPPAKVVGRRFGDCKDKTRLLVGMLVALGIDAYPVLVSDKRRHTVAELVPSAFVFDHVIVGMDGGTQGGLSKDGAPVYVDPTRSHQAGPLEEIGVSDFGVGLPIRAGADALVAVRPRPSSLRHIEISHRWKLPLEGPSRASLEVLSQHRGVAAEETRQALDDTGEDELAEQYRGYYEKVYGDVAISDQPTFTDDLATNTLTVRERYHVGGFAAYEKDGGQARTLTFWSPEVDSYLPQPALRRPPGPLGIGRTGTILHTTTISLPTPIDIAPSEERVVAEPGLLLTYSQARTEDGLELTLVRRFERAVWWLSAEAVADYRDKVREAKRLLSWEIRASTRMGAADTAESERLRDQNAWRQGELQRQLRQRTTDDAKLHAPSIVLVSLGGAGALGLFFFFTFRFGRERPLGGDLPTPSPPTSSPLRAVAMAAMLIPVVVILCLPDGDWAWLHWNGWRPQTEGAGPWTAERNLATVIWLCLDLVVVGGTLGLALALAKRPALPRLGLVAWAGLMTAISAALWGATPSQGRHFAPVDARVVATATSFTGLLFVWLMQRARRHRGTDRLTRSLANHAAETPNDVDMRGPASQVPPVSVSEGS